MKILVSVPNEGWIHKQVCFVTDRLLRDPRVTLIRPTHRPYENNLQHIVNQFREQGFDWWLNIDADNPPMKNPLELIELDLPIIGLPTPIVHFLDEDKHGERPVYWNGYRAIGDEYTEWTPKEGLQKVDAMGTGCFLIARRVFEHPELRHGAFLRQWAPDGTVYKGNDISFCERAREAGFDIHMHYDYPCQHIHELDIALMVKAFNQYFEPLHG